MYHGAVAIFESPLSTASSKFQNAPVYLEGSSLYAGVGASVLAQDINGDGVDDLVVGADGISTEASWAGSLFIIYGPHRASGSVEAYADWRAVGTSEDEQVGENLFEVADMTGDGSEDFAMSAVRSATSSTAVPDGGAVYLFTSADTGETIARESASTQICSNTATDNLGYGVTSLDLDADGIADIATGAENAGDDDEGLAGIFFGPLGASLDFYDADILWNGVDTFDSFGFSLVADDFNSDGVDDLVISAPGADPEDSGRGNVYFFFGDSSITSTSGLLSAGDADHKITNDIASSQLEHLTALGDINLDGSPDLGTTALGGFIFHGPFGGGIHAASTVVSVQLNTRGDVGETDLPFMLNGGDLFDDGADDLVIGSPNYTGGESVPGYGRTYIISGVTW